MWPFVPHVNLVLVLFFKASLGQRLDQFLEEHRLQIQYYIMTGYGGGWTNCDILAANPIHIDAPQFLMELEAFDKVEMGSIFSSSYCVLACYYVESKERLSDIIKLGWNVIRHKRIALILSLAKDVTLDMATDTEHLPFLIAATHESGQKQFLCPVIGIVEPLMQGHMCDNSYVSYKYKKLRIGILGINPHVIFQQGGMLDGTDVRLLSLLAKKLKFMPDIIVPRTFDQGANMVKKLTDHFMEHHNTNCLSVCGQRNRYNADEGLLSQNSISRQRIYETNWRNEFSLSSEESTANSKLSNPYQSI